MRVVFLALVTPLINAIKSIRRENGTINEGSVAVIVLILTLFGGMGWMYYSKLPKEHHVETTKEIVVDAMGDEEIKEALMDIIAEMTGGADTETAFSDAGK